MPPQNAASFSRRFIRHSMNVPIELMAADAEATHAENISAGGLAIRCRHALPPGALVHIRIAIPKIAFETDARVAWCRPSRKDVQVGVTFLNSEDAYQVRMIEQMCYIEDYRKRIQQDEGRELSIAEAAAEWVGKYADSFPNP